MCIEVEARANNCENKAYLWKDFKNSFAWLTGMKKPIFDYNNFFGLGHFMTHYTLKIDQKMTGSKKFIKVKNQFIHARQPREGIFEIRLY